METPRPERDKFKASPWPFRGAKDKNNNDDDDNNNNNIKLRLDKPKRRLHNFQAPTWNVYGSNVTSSKLQLGKPDAPNKPKDTTEQAK